MIFTSILSVVIIFSCRHSIVDDPFLENIVKMFRHFVMLSIQFHSFLVFLFLVSLFNQGFNVYSFILSENRYNTRENLLQCLTVCGKNDLAIAKLRYSTRIKDRKVRSLERMRHKSGNNGNENSEKTKVFVDDNDPLGMKHILTNAENNKSPIPSDLNEFVDLAAKLCHQAIDDKKTKIRLDLNALQFNPRSPQFSSFYFHNYAINIAKKLAHFGSTRIFFRGPQAMQIAVQDMEKWTEIESEREGNLTNILNEYVDELQKERPDIDLIPLPKSANEVEQRRTQEYINFVTNVKFSSICGTMEVFDKRLYGSADWKENVINNVNEIIQTKEDPNPDRVLILVGLQNSNPVEVLATQRILQVAEENNIITIVINMQKSDANGIEPKEMRQYKSAYYMLPLRIRKYIQFEFEEDAEAWYDINRPLLKKDRPNASDGEQESGNEKEFATIQEEIRYNQEKARKEEEEKFQRERVEAREKELLKNQADISDKDKNISASKKSVDFLQCLLQRVYGEPYKLFAIYDEKEPIYELVDSYEKLPSMEEIYQKVNTGIQVRKYTTNIFNKE